MDKATQTMIENLRKQTGKSLEQWIAIVNKAPFGKHGEIVKFLKDQHGFTHGFANLVAHKAKATDAGSAEDPQSLIDRQYEGKEHFRPLYERLVKEIGKFGGDIEIAPKNTYVSLRRKKQFAILQPATKTHFERGLNLKGQAPQGKLEAMKPNAMCSHKISVTGEAGIDGEVLKWLGTAYERAQ